MTGNEGSGGLLPEETLAVAIAYAERLTKSAAISRKIVADVQGVPYEERPDELERISFLGQAAMLLQRVENPDEPLSIQELADAYLGDEGYEVLAEQVSSMREEDVTPAEAKAISGAHMNAIQEATGISDEDLAKDFAKQLEAAKAIAEEKGISVAEVYNDESLYYETAARAGTPAKFANDAKKTIEANSVDSMVKVFEQMANTFIPQEELDEMAPGELKQILEAMKQDPMIQMVMDQQLGVVREAMRQACLYRFIKTFGYDAINDLSTEQREAILPTMPLAEDLAELVRTSS